jgi:hypothetical protein
MNALDKLSKANFRLARDPLLYMGLADEARAELREHYESISNRINRRFPATLPNGMKLQGVNGFKAVYVSPESYVSNEVVHNQADGLDYFMDEDLQLRLCARPSTGSYAGQEKKSRKQKKKS